MKQPIVLGTAVVIVLGAAALGVAASAEIFLFTEPLDVGNITREEGRALPHEYTAHFNDNAGEEVARLTAEVWPLVESQRRLLVSVWHGPGTRLDSLSLTLRTAEIEPAIALKAPGGRPQMLSRFHLTDRARSVTLAVPELGVQGEGTVTREFILGAAGELPEQLRVEAHITLHEETFPRLVDHEGHTTLEVGLGKRR